MNSSNGMQDRYGRRATPQVYRAVFAHGKRLIFPVPSGCKRRAVYDDFSGGQKLALDGSPLVSWLSGGATSRRTTDASRREGPCSICCPTTVGGEVWFSQLLSGSSRRTIVEKERIAFRRNKYQRIA